MQFGAMEADHVLAVVHGLYMPFGRDATTWMIEAGQDKDRLVHRLLQLVVPLDEPGNRDGTRKEACD